MLAFNTAIITALTSLSAFADLSPISATSKAQPIADQANAIFSVTNVRSGTQAYKLVTMDTVLNGDVGTTSVLLTGQDVGGEAGYDAAFLLSPRSDSTTDAMGISGLVATANGVEITYSDSNGLSKKRTASYDAKAKILKEGPSAPAKNCDSEKSTNDTFQCLLAEGTRADAALKAAYTKAKASSDPVGATKLKASEKAWLAFRTAQCTLQADEMRGGSEEKVINAGCYASMTEKRTADLLGSILPR